MEHHCKICNIRLKVSRPKDYNCIVRDHENSNRHQKNIGNKLTGVVYLYTHNGKAYVGSTTNETERKQNHRTVCFNPTAKNHNMPLYAYIRENNLTFDDLHFEVIEEFVVDDENELKQHEQNYIDIFKEHYTLLNCYSSYLTDEIKKEQQKKFDKTHYDIVKSVKEKCDNCNSIVAHCEITRHKRTDYCINYHENLKDPNKVKCDNCELLVTVKGLNKHKKTDGCKKYIKQL